LKADGMMVTAPFSRRTWVATPQLLMWRGPPKLENLPKTRFSHPASAHGRRFCDLISRSLGGAHEKGILQHGYISLFFQEFHIEFRIGVLFGTLFDTLELFGYITSSFWC
jgi:hypothetical protein